MSEEDSGGCIFCRRVALNDHEEHILPDSLGGDAWGVLAPGLVCRACNNYFGSKVEQPALSSFPFLAWRVLTGIPTKKDKLARLNVIQGSVQGTGIGGVVDLAPNWHEISDGVGDGQMSRMTLLAQVTETAAVCQLLLKIGLEIIASHNPGAARSQRYDAARRTARAPEPGSKWSFVLTTDKEEFARYLKYQPYFFDSVSSLNAEVSEFDGGDYLHLRMMGFDLICPMEVHEIDPTVRALPSPRYQLYEITFGPKRREVHQ